MKKLLTAMLALLMLVGIIAIPAMAEDDDIYIAMFPKGYTGDFWKSVEAGAQQAAEDLGVTITFEGPQSETDLEGQIRLIENAIIKEPDVIAIAPLDSIGNVPVIESANEKGIKVITFNSKLESDIPLTHVATDNWVAGEMAGQKLGELLGGQGKYAVIGAVESVKNNRDRSDGAVSYIEENYPDMELITIQYTEGDLNRALSAASDIITANPDIAGFFTNNETTTIGLATVLQEKGLAGEIVHVGFDATLQTVGYLEDGTTAAIVSQNPYNMGYMAVEKALAAYNGEALEPEYDTGVAMVTVENLYDADIQQIVDPEGSAN